MVFINSSLSLKKLKANAKLERLILEDALYEEIVRHSQKLDMYIQMQFKQMNKGKRKKLAS